MSFAAIIWSSPSIFPYTDRFNRVPSSFFKQQLQPQAVQIAITATVWRVGSVDTHFSVHFWYFLKEHVTDPFPRSLRSHGRCLGVGHGTDSTPQHPCVIAHRLWCLYGGAIAWAGQTPVDTLWEYTDYPLYIETRNRGRTKCPARSCLGVRQLSTSGPTDWRRRWGRARQVRAFPLWWMH